MFKRMMLIAVVTAVSLALFTGTGLAASMLKVAFVDLQDALNATSEGIAAKETLRKKHRSKQEQIDRMKAELETMEEKIKSPVISEEAQTELQESYRRKKAQFIEMISKANEDVERENQQLSARILEGLIQITREIGEAENYSMILEKSGSAVVYFEEAMDITDRIVKIYNERYQAEETQ